MAQAQETANPMTKRTAAARASARAAHGEAIVTMRFYEVHEYVGGRWELATVSDEATMYLNRVACLSQKFETNLWGRTLG